MSRQLILPATLIFLIGVGVGFSLFPHMFPAPAPAPAQEDAQLQPEPSTIASPDSTTDYDMADIPPLPEQEPLTSSDQEAYVLQLFSPTSGQVDAMQVESEHLKLLEQTMMISYLLSNCRVMQKDEYERTFEALVKYLKNYGEPDPYKSAMASAKRAAASYKMVYRHVPCDDPSLYQMAASLREWRQSVVPDNETPIRSAR